jgi:hypothetical protein
MAFFTISPLSGISHWLLRFILRPFAGTPTQRVGRNDIQRQWLGV